MQSVALRRFFSAFAHFYAMDFMRRSGATEHSRSCYDRPTGKRIEVLPSVVKSDHRSSSPEAAALSAFSPRLSSVYYQPTGRNPVDDRLRMVDFGVNEEVIALYGIETSLWSE